MKLLLVVAALILAPLLAFAADAPSRPPEKGCAWERFSDPALGLEAWVQRCDFGFRRIDFVAAGKSLAIRYSDGGAPAPVVDVLGRLAGESGEAALKRIFAAHTDAERARRCVLRRFEGTATRAGVERFTFAPNDDYARDLERSASPDEVPEPPCGPWGEAPDGIQYFELHPSSAVARILFVRLGQDTPLFDEQTLGLLGGR